METTFCHSIRDVLSTHLAAGVHVMPWRELCIIALPWKTPDDRLVDVYVEPDAEPGRYRVHDGGKSLSELYAQGIHTSDERADYFTRLAARFEATFEDDTFLKVTRWPELASSVLAIGQCATLAMQAVVRHDPVFERVIATAHVARGLQRWRSEEIERIDEDVRVQGHQSYHRFQFVAQPRPALMRQPLALKILRPTYSPRVAAERYGFMVLDLDRLDVGRWPRLVVVTQAERWQQAQLRLVQRLSRETLTVRSGEEALLEDLVPAAMTVLAA